LQEQVPYKFETGQNGSQEHLHLFSSSNQNKAQNSRG